jgi:hypothetical protein
MNGTAVVAFEGKRELGWYVHLVHNRTLLGSLATLVHAPFMIAFLAVVAIGAYAAPVLDPTVLVLSLAVVALLLYGEHMLDDMTRVGKPWATVFSDRDLALLAATMFFAAALIAAAASYAFGSPLPLLGVLAGIAFCVLYGLEVWHFHALAFGALGYGAIPAFAYEAQVIVTGTGAPDPIVIAVLLVVGIVLGYVMLALYEHTKTNAHRVAWRLLAFHFALIYGIAGVMVWLRI